MKADALPVLKGKYCNSLTDYSRLLTREVVIGDVPMGGTHPIRIQSMTTTDTMDTIGTVEQSIRMANAGCEYVRITAPSMKEAKNLAEIKKELKKRGYTIPLIADIHFTPNAAEVAARLVEKVRINPGNYADKKRFENLEYTHAEYQAELERIYKKFIPLVQVCKEYGTAMRIGTNHGSLSDRIMSHYGDTPQGMVESAMEFIRMCQDQHYYNLVISMKSSNPQVMVQAYRLLVATMAAEGMNYPLHLGVTEAGDGEDGRIKSAVGIGTLLEDGLGDTIRVSLTEEPEYEAPVAIALAKRYEVRKLAIRDQRSEIGNPKLEIGSPLSLREGPGVKPYTKRLTAELNTFIGGHQVPRVVISLAGKNLKDPAVLAGAGYLYSALLDKYNMGEQSADFVYLGDDLPSFSFPGNLKQVYNHNTWLKLADKTNCHPLYGLQEYIDAEVRCPALNLVRINTDELLAEAFNELPLDNTLVIVLETDKPSGMADQREAFLRLVEMGLDVPVIVRRSYSSQQSAVGSWQSEVSDQKSEIGDRQSEIGSQQSEIGGQQPLNSNQLMDENLKSQISNLKSQIAENFQLYAATDLGGLLIDGFGDGIWADAPGIDTVIVLSTSFGILQATRSRISKTEYISCPSCGRTLFDLQETTQMIRSRTDHLKGLKIGIMGCIVNGPGEMADADYGYVGTGPGKITLYRGKEIVKKSVNTDQALDELIEIIRQDGNWVEPG